MRYYAGLAVLVIVTACGAQNSTSNVPALRGPGATERAASKIAPAASATTYPTPYPESTQIALTPNGPHTFTDLEGGTTAGRSPAAYTVTVSGTYPPFAINPAGDQVVAGNNVSFSPTDNLTCIDNELDATGTPNGSTITAVASTVVAPRNNTRRVVAVAATNAFNFILRLGPDNISPPTQFGCRWYFQDSLLGIHRITMYAGGPSAHPLTISPNTIQLSGSYPFVTPPSQSITISEPDPNNAFYFGRTGYTFDGALLCSSVDGLIIGECRDAASQTYDVNVAGAGTSSPPPHLLLQNLGAANNHSLTLSYSGTAPNPVGSVTTLMIYDASGNYAPLIVNW